MQCQGAQFFFGLPSRAQSLPVSSCCAHRIFFFLCPVASTLQGSQQFFFFAQSLPVNSCCAHRFFFLTGQSHTLVPCAQLFVFVSGRCLLSFDSSRSNFFVTGRCVARAARKIFFVTSVQKCEGGRVRRKYFFCHSRASVSCQGAMQIFVFIHSHAKMQGAQNFSFAQLFLLPSGLICAETLF
jgi:hypothetical protein